MEELEALKEELQKLKSEKAAFQVQNDLLENFVALAQSGKKEEMLHALLQKTLEVSTDLTGAEKGSLFLLNSAGVVVDSILARGDISAAQRLQLIGKVLDEGLAGWVRRNRQVGLVSDTENDDRWLDLPNQPYSVRSALAVPILRGNNLLGLLTLLHSRPGHFSTVSADLMKLTAAQIGAALENARLYAALDRYSKALNAELEKGKNIQKEFLPDQIPLLPGWEIAVCFQPARQVSGDFYDAFLLPSNYLGLVIADVCDKGVGSALFMALFRSLIRVFSGQISLSGLYFSKNVKVSKELDFIRPLNAVALTNDYIAEEHGEEGMFATLFFGVLNPISGELAYVNAGHEPLMIVGPSGSKARLTAAGPAVGGMPGIRYKARRARLEPGDILIGYTDGVTEALSPDKQLFGKHRFTALAEQPADSATGLIKRIEDQISRHIQNAPLFDDITMIALRRELR